MFWESSGVVGFDHGPLLEGQMRTAKLKSAYNSLIIGPRGFGALSLRWIQFASVLRCARSSLSLPPHCYREIKCHISVIMLKCASAIKTAISICIHRRHLVDTLV